MKLRYYALWLSLICIVVFIFQNLFSFITEALLLNNSVLNGEIWRFITAIFIHGSLEHLIFNLFALIMFGLILENLIGSNKFLIVFFASGIIANLISVNFYNSSLGASGAIFGIIGCLTLIKPLMAVWAFGMPMPMFIASILWAGLDVLGIFAPSGTANIAHLSGLAIGLILGILFRINKKKQSNNKIVIKLPEFYVRNWEDRNIK